LARRLLVTAVLAVLVAAPAGARSNATKLTVFAAASLTEAFQAFDPGEA
jgi:ABC-type molybdate transport system substrate-binding protein